MNKTYLEIKKYIQCLVTGHDLVEDTFEGSKATIGKNQTELNDFSASLYRCVHCGQIKRLDVVS